MALIEDVQVIRFANEGVRPMANALYNAYFQAKQLLLNYNSDNIGTLISNAGAGNIIDDGSSRDGRTQITGGDVFNLITATQAFVAYVEGGAVSTADRTGVITLPHVGG